jgi:hypothetical protein
MLVPYLLAAWAIANETHQVFAEIDDEGLDQYATKIDRLQSLSNDVILVWSAIPLVPRNLMIKMWLTRSPSHNGIAHPTPAIQQALHTMRSDPYLTREERNLATTVILVATNGQGIRLFGDQN